MKHVLEEVGEADTQGGSLSLEEERHSHSQTQGQEEKMRVEVNIWGCQGREKGCLHVIATVFLET